ncbi:hypothetical protein CIB93_14150 [Streptomyces sp. WZ.A104]|uniref:hypothetical protein n=1 Tax=Streptomyces sp. WZ.A104 TaxID=2023771 RepID=UPI000BBBBB13|nr:hypothetical protein [Streptomyces sp. WZ.A104]PCG85491.1 hypothetical protein CIB93_14150 [Streptomyces sp. WZ.A104]
MITPTANAGWVSSAPCAGADGYVPSDGQLGAPDRLMEASAPLMQACVESCPFIVACYDRVRPDVGFDGVCAGRLWIDGTPVAVAEGAPRLRKLPSRAGICGTSSGVAGHRRVGEPLCGDCRVTAQRADTRKAGAATIRTRRRSKPTAVVAA